MAKSSTLLTRAPVGSLTPQLALAHADSSSCDKIRPDRAHPSIGSFNVTRDPSSRTTVVLTFTPPRAFAKASFLCFAGCRGTPSLRTRHSDVHSPRTFIGSGLVRVV